MAKEQSASTSDGVSGAPLKGQKEMFDNGNNPAGMSGSKERRNTGEIKQGTAYLRSKIAGENPSRMSE